MGNFESIANMQLAAMGSLLIGPLTLVSSKLNLLEDLGGHFSKLAKGQMPPSTTRIYYFLIKRRTILGR